MTLNFNSLKIFAWAPGFDHTDCTVCPHLGEDQTKVQGPESIQGRPFRAFYYKTAKL